MMNPIGGFGHMRRILLMCKYQKNNMQLLKN